MSWAAGSSGPQRVIRPSACVTDIESRSSDTCPTYYRGAIVGDMHRILILAVLAASLLMPSTALSAPTKTKHANWQLKGTLDRLEQERVHRRVRNDYVEILELVIRPDGITELVRVDGWKIPQEIMVVPAARLRKNTH